MDGAKSSRIDGLSKLTKIEELRLRVRDDFEVETPLQRLFYRGKQLEDGYTLFDYDVGLNDIIQLLARQALPEPAAPVPKEEQPKQEPESAVAGSSGAGRECNKEPENAVAGSSGARSKYYKVGGLVDVLNSTHGAWFEAKIIDIVRKESTVPEPTPEESASRRTADDDDDILYCIQFDDYEDERVTVPLSSIRPRARRLIPFADVSVGDALMANYNVEDPDELGFWYDCEVTAKRATRTTRELSATVYVGASRTPLNNCRLKFCDELFAIEGHPTVTSEECDKLPESPVKRRLQPDCTHCGDRPERKCRHCACCRCGGKEDPSRQLLCDECDRAFHLGCLDPPLEELPQEDTWFCPECKTDTSEVVQPGEGLKDSKRKAKLPSAAPKAARDWGRGMACAGRTKECTLVPPNHYGPLPNIPVGSCWKFRLQVSESGCHRPPVGGIHGRESDGAYSIVLSGGYEDDADDGDEFLYTGSGGRDLSGNKRTAEQSCNQELTKYNKSLARNCAAELNAKDGAEAKDWRAGKPVRVLRSYKGRKHSKYCPEEGCRYDGIYKVVKYWPEKGKSGFIVWRFLLRRDDPTPPPWTSAGKKHIEELGLTMQYPEGYQEPQNGEEHNSENEVPAKKGKRSRGGASEASSPTPKKQRAASFSLEAPLAKQVRADACNERLWQECLTLGKGRQAFLDRVQELFTCVCCQELAYLPVTTPCSHNLCQGCLKRSFKAEVFCCPTCRKDLGKDYELKVNTTLSGVLQALFPGYENGR